MNDPNSWAALIGSLGWVGWPLVAGVALFILRGPITDLISRISQITYKDITVDFERLREIGREAQLDPLDKVEIDDRTVDSIEHYPRAAVIEAWIRLEWEAREILRGADERPPPRTPRQMIQRLHREGLLQGNLFELLTELREIRNSAAHQLDVNIDPELAQEYVQLAELATTAIQENAERRSQESQ